MVKHNPDAAPFYNELIEVLEVANGCRPAASRFTMRFAITRGLGLRDAFSGKIKSGLYKPTIDRLRNLANLLGVHPTTFGSYVLRFAHERVDASPHLFEAFRMIATQDPDVQVLLEAGIPAYLRAVIDKAAKLQNGTIE